MIDLRLGDCLEVMKAIPDNSIDMVLTDPPYGTTACKWDSVIPFEPMWEQLKRIRKEKSAIVLFGTEPFSSYLRISNIKEFKYDWIWQKDRGANFASAKFNPIKYHEIITVFNSKTYYPQKIPRESNRVAQGIKNKNINWTTTRQDGNNVSFNKNYKPRRFDAYDADFKLPSSVIYNPIVSSSSKEKKVGQHPTQKPVALLEYLIKTYTIENETVLDFTMGSGSTGVACKNLNRNFIGIEKDEMYFNIAKERIENTCVQIKLES